LAEGDRGQILCNFMTFHLLKDQGKKGNAWEEAPDPATGKQLVEDTRGKKPAPEAVPPEVLREGRCRFRGVSRSAGLPIFSRTSITSSMSRT
jgi:hypothetical protein